MEELPEEINQMIHKYLQKSAQRVMSMSFKEIEAYTLGLQDMQALYVEINNFMIREQQTGALDSMGQQEFQQFMENQLKGGNPDADEHS